MNKLMPMERIERRIYLIRGQKVMLDRDLAELYGVPTKVLNQSVKRNNQRFPGDFMFSLTRQEILRMSQIVTSYDNQEMLRLKYYKNINVFTENGVAMLSSVLRTERAILVNVQIMRAFTRLRQIIATHGNLGLKLDLLKEKFGKRLDKHDREIALIFDAIRKMLTIEEKPKDKIGFVVER